MDNRFIPALETKTRNEKTLRKEYDWEGGSGWGTHVNPWLIHVNVWQKTLQYL